MVRRGNLFDESKIIKKDSNIKQEETITTGSPIVLNNKQEELPNPIKNEQPKEAAVIKNDFPVFSVEQNKYTGKVESRNIPKEYNIKINIPKDQLQLINVNNNRYINELVLELAILDSLLKAPNDNYDFYKSKFDYLSLELEFANKKKDTIKKLLEG